MKSSRAKRTKRADVKQKWTRFDQWNEDWAVVYRFSVEEREAILELAKLQELTPLQVLRQALRGYQVKIKDIPALGPGGCGE